ncbi:Hsp33 family molecular chaperone HslO [Candidatus Puniceispirillum sp.]|uniref:Hsp33 family molecular chaperone HslO n=1 Tax=Candidatus Puniceispirillum sp. TaxID=2026719 RepID=UPI001EB75979|nr:Hsp33 family molecular chaperone HslO [Candidatus Puniceispirillum sp.]
MDIVINDNLRPDAQILPFYLADEHTGTPLVRGRIASVGHVADTILARHNYPQDVALLQAEALAMTACLSSTLKFDGIFTLQAKGDGRARTLFADITETGAMRGYTAFAEDTAAVVSVYGVSNLPQIMGTGYMAFTVDEGATGGRYQGIVELDGPELRDAAMAWFANSEQLETTVTSASGLGDDGWQATAMMLQRIATEGGKNPNKADIEMHDDVWHTAKTLMASVKQTELLSPEITPDQLVFRLFNTLSPHVAPARPVMDECRCNMEKVEAILKQLKPEDADDLLDDDGTILVTCEFCKTERRFDTDVLAG